MGEGREKREMVNGECKMEKFGRPDSPDNKTYSKAETYYNKRKKKGSYGKCYKEYIRYKTE